MIPKRRILKVLVTTFFVGLILGICVPTVSRADSPPARCKGLLCQVEAETGQLPGGKSSNPRPARQSGGGNNGDERFERAARKAVEDYDRQYAAFENARAAYDDCVRRAVATCGAEPVPPIPSTFNAGSFGGQGAQPLPVTGAQAAAIALARLQLPTIAPGIGPSPDLNRWKIAAVGYPLWLWADGPTHVGPVSDSVAGLSVSLEARVTSLTFRMGDGNTVNCQGDGDQWTEAVEPGAKAPSCGHTYTEASLPEADYKVSAVTNWAVTWTANGQSGVINVPAVQTTELPVGELQVLIR